MDAQAYSTSPIAEIQAESEEIISPEHSLKVALGKINRKTSAKQIFFAWPNLEEACKRFARMLTHHYPLDKENALLPYTLQRAFEKYETTALNSMIETEPMAAFLNELIVCGALSINFTVYGVLMNGKTIEWRPYEYPLVDWAKKIKAAHLIFLPARKPPNEKEFRGARILLASHIASFDDIVFIEANKP